MKSIRLTGTQYPTVVLVPPSLPRCYRALLEGEGSVVRDVAGLVIPSVNLSPEEQSVVHFKNKLLLWGLKEFERIVFLEFDDLGAISCLRWGDTSSRLTCLVNDVSCVCAVLHSLDQLFLCDQFCAIDKSPLLYTSSLWVVTPSDEKTV